MIRNARTEPAFLAAAMQHESTAKMMTQPPICL